jgi:hypothetical protein
MRAAFLRKRSDPARFFENCLIKSLFAGNCATLIGSAFGRVDGRSDQPYIRRGKAAS